MNVDSLAIELSVDKAIVERAVLTNGFSIDTDFDNRQANLIRMYVDYLQALEDARQARVAFKYADGEEAVDKSRVFDQYRKFANDLKDSWEEAKKAYDKDLVGKGSFFTIRNRAGFLDERFSR